ncbi:HutD family protein [Amycolatopsis sp. WGS_07]|uniref:HutD family protein n=1 Tax=Amycolatopsis sp. WGS_07 TaxID=3076764 RepID=UPI0038739695
MPRVSQQYKDDQRGEILAAARRCFLRDGFHRTSMQDVFAEAGKSAGAVYRYFPKKEDMIVAVAAQNLDDVAGVLRAVLARGTGGSGVGEVMAELLEAVLGLHRDRQLAGMAVQVWAEAQRNPDLASRLTAATVEMSGEIAALVGERPDADALAQVILSLLPGFLFNLALSGPDAVAGFPDAVRTLFPAVSRPSDLLVPSEVTPAPWRNGAGTTRELATETDPSGETCWRISVADLLEDAPFSAFPGIDRLFTALGPLRLTVNGVPKDLKRGDQLRFAGEDEVTVSLDQPTQALNVMTQRGRYRAEVVLRAPNAGRTAGSTATVDLGEQVADIVLHDA